MPFKDTHPPGVPACRSCLSQRAQQQGSSQLWKPWVQVYNELLSGLHRHDFFSFSSLTHKMGRREASTKNVSVFCALHPDKFTTFTKYNYFRV